MVGREAIGILDRERAGAAVVDLEAVVQRQLGALDDAFKDAAGMDLLELDRGFAPVEQHADLTGGRAQGANRHPVGPGMGAEHGVGAGVLALDEQVEFLGGDAHDWYSLSASFAPAKVAMQSARPICQSGSSERDGASHLHGLQ